jgi:hemerythrin superfamily protein
MARSKQSKDAIALLKADHRQVEELFGQFEKARDDERKQELAMQVCTALRIHTIIEEEIFYPAFLEASDDVDIHHEAELEHEGAKNLIARIEASSPGDDYFVPAVKVLSEMIKHHVREEEKPDGMFAVARETKMDLAALGEELASRKAELESGESDDADMAPPGLGDKRGQTDRLMKETR